MQKESNRELFAQYVKAVFEPATPAAQAPEPPTTPAEYPILRDAGSLPAEFLPDLRSARDQFAEWMGGQMQFDPFKSPDGWKPLF